MSENMGKKTAAIYMSWFVYVMIFFEMLYMATPFAIFFYSVYGAPLKWLNASPHTAWLIQAILPHFSQTGNLFINTILLISWPLMIIGLLIFLIGFVQIYWAKFTKKEVVLSGIYRYIRHPQYAACSLFGLGMAMIWSRMIVLLMLVTMWFFYYWLARSEERDCMQKYGDSYGDYMAQTGMFFPKLTKAELSSSKFKLPENRFIKSFLIFGMYVALMLVSIIVAQLLRTYAISQLSTYPADNYLVLSVMQLSEEKIASELVIALNSIRVQDSLKNSFDMEQDKLLIYSIPGSLEASELGVEESQLYEGHSGQTMIVNQLIHRNFDEDNSVKKLIFSKAITEENVQGIDILRECRWQIPRWIVTIDTEFARVTEIVKAPAKGRYRNIPIPIY